VRIYQELRPPLARISKISGHANFPSPPHIPEGESIILLSDLTSYIGEMNGDHQFGFRRNKSVIDKLFCINVALEKKIKFDGTALTCYRLEKKCFPQVREIADLHFH
jgi:hypothetical protein